MLPTLLLTGFGALLFVFVLRRQGKWEQGLKPPSAAR